MSFLKFVEFEDTGKTKKFEIKTIAADNILGQIKWYGAWRKYCFYPLGGTIFDVNCMNEIISFINKLMQDRKDEK